jgi:hypothetical protein
VRRRLAAGGLSAIGFLLGAPLWVLPASAAEAPTVSFAFAADSTPGTLSGQAAMPSGLSGVTRVSLSVVSLADGSVGASRVQCDPCEYPNNPVEFSWATPALAYNGPYRLTVTAVGTEYPLDINGPETTTASRVYRLAAPAQRPTGPRAEVLPDRTVRVSWNRLTAHPDLFGYELKRKAPGGSFVTVTGIDQPSSGATVSFVDPVPAQSEAAGLYEYEIRAVRQGAFPDVASAVFSAPAAASATVPAAPVPTTATPPPGEGAGDGTGEGAQGGTGSQTGTGANGGIVTGGGGTPPTNPPSLDLGSFLSRGSGTFTPPPTQPAPTIPDGGFSESLPFASTTSRAPVEGRQPGRPAAVSATGELSRPGDDEPGLSEQNRRALLVPLAAGSVLCVAALHLRWLSRRLAEPPGGLAPATEAPLADGDDGFDEEETVALAPFTHEYVDDLFDDDAFLPDPKREPEPVGAGTGRGRARTRAAR